VLVGGLVTLVALRLLPELRRRLTPVETDASGERPAG